MSKALFEFENASIRIGSDMILKNIDWKVKPGESWAVLGPNGSGKSTLVRALLGETNVVRGELKIQSQSKKGTRNKDSENKKYNFQKYEVGYVSFELLEKLLEFEKNSYEAKYFSGKVNEFTTTAQVIASGLESALAESDAPLSPRVFEARLEKTAKKLRIKTLLGRDINALSAGQLRKAMIARALVKEPKILVLDEPFDGLDKASRRALKTVVNKLIASKKVTVILITHKQENISESISHVLLLKDGRVFNQGTRKKVLTRANVKMLFKKPFEDKRSVFDPKFLAEFAKDVEKEMEREVPDELLLVEMRDVNVSFDGESVLENFTWQMKRGENWALLGPNGSGKSTIVKLILGENLQYFSNKIRVLGRSHDPQKQSYIKDIREGIGIVSSELHAQYDQSTSVFNVIASGFYDSIGIYSQVSEDEAEIVVDWAKGLEIDSWLERDFSTLSNGQKKIVLIARALVKAPPLLILDEPFNGVDEVNTDHLLDIIDAIGESGITNILFISHYEDEIPDCITHILEIEEHQMNTSTND